MRDGSINVWFLKKQRLQFLHHYGKIFTLFQRDRLPKVPMMQLERTWGNTPLSVLDLISLPQTSVENVGFFRGILKLFCILWGGKCLCLFCKFIPLEENHHQVKASPSKGKTLPPGNLLWQVDAGLIPVLRNILRLVLTNWPLMESVFVGPDSCREHLQSCFNGDWVLMAQKSACSPVVGTQTFFAWVLPMCKNMTFFCNPAENDKVASKHSMGMSDSADKGLLQRKECSLLFPPCLPGKTKAEARKHKTWLRSAPSCSLLSGHP